MTGDERSESFLARWSRRKEAPPEDRAREDARIDAEAAPPAEPTPEKPPADLPAIETLTPDSDFTRFMRPDAPAASRNAAVKKLFADPHFNLMDGLDTYIDDYTKADPIPLEMLKDLAQSRMLKLFDESPQEQDPVENTGDDGEMRTEPRETIAAPAADIVPVIADESPGVTGS